MFSFPMKIFLLFCLITGNYATYRYSATSPEWIAYKQTFSKSYTAAEESRALYNFNLNMLYIDKHNRYAESNRYSYTLQAGPFTDMRKLDYFAKFPQVTQLGTSQATAPPPAVAASPTYDIRDWGVPVRAEFQGTACNSGWAYAVAASIQLRKAAETRSTVYTPLSAQNLIDCAGGTRACRNQVSQAGFDYTRTQPIHTQTIYPNQNTLTTSNVCSAPLTTAVGQTRVTKYSRIADGNNELLKQYVSADYPVVVEFNPNSFEFMNYASGIFTLPATKKGSHYLTIIGYGRDATTGTDYWTALNSFGPNWGENGLIRIARTASIAKSALFPTELSYVN